MLLTRIHFGIIADSKPVRSESDSQAQALVVQPREKDAVQHQLKCLNLAWKAWGVCMGNDWLPWDGLQAS